MAPDGNPRPNPRPPEDPSVYNVPTPEPARKPKGKTGWIKGLAAAIAFVALAFAFSRLIPGSGSPTDPPGNWENNVFKTNSEHIKELSPEELSQAPLLPGIGWERQAIRSVTFLSKQRTTGAVADISVDGDGSVVAWVQSDGELCDLYIAGNGGINAADACPYMFAGCTNLIRVDFGDGFHTDYATDMSHMFYGCTSLTKLDLSSFNTERVTNMTSMFDHAFCLTELDLSSFNTENVTDMGYMFCGCESLTKLDLNHFNTEQVTDMCGMFAVCDSLTELDLSSFNTENVIDTTCMFLECRSLTELDLSGFNTEQVISMGGMFASCDSLTELDLSSFNTEQVTVMAEMFWGCPGVTVDDVAHFDTSSVTSFEYFMDGTGWEYLFE